MPRGTIARMRATSASNPPSTIRPQWIPVPRISLLPCRMFAGFDPPRQLVLNMRLKLIPLEDVGREVGGSLNVSQATSSAARADERLRHVPFGGRVKVDDLFSRGNRT